MLRERGFTIVMVEQNFRFAAPLADRFYVMEHGRIVEALRRGRAARRRRDDAARSTSASERLPHSTSISQLKETT